MFFTVVTLCSEFISFKNYYDLISSFNSLVREDYYFCSHVHIKMHYYFCNTGMYAQMGSLYFVDMECKLRTLRIYQLEKSTK